MFPSLSCVHGIDTALLHDTVLECTPVFVKRRISTRMVRIIWYVRDRRATFAFRVFV